MESSTIIVKIKITLSSLKKVEYLEFNEKCLEIACTNRKKRDYNYFLSKEKQQQNLNINNNTDMHPTPTKKIINSDYESIYIKLINGIKLQDIFNKITCCIQIINNNSNNYLTVINI